MGYSLFLWHTTVGMQLKAYPWFTQNVEGSQFSLSSVISLCFTVSCTTIWSTHRCTSGCVDGRYGDKCNQYCTPSGLCQRCQQETGTCFACRSNSYLEPPLCRGNISNMLQTDCLLTFSFLCKFSSSGWVRGQKQKYIKNETAFAK